MYGVKEVGKYNVDFSGSIYDGKILYEMIIIEEFNKKDEPTGRRKTLYFRNDKKYKIPGFSTEKEVDKWFSYKNYSKIAICRTENIYMEE